MIASLLTEETLTLENIPRLADVDQLIRILSNHGVDYSMEGRRKEQQCGYSQTMHFNAGHIATTRAPYEMVSKMRASFWVIGALLARMGEASVSLPGGCAIGTRPVDFILEGLRALGADVQIEKGYAHAKANKGLHGTAYHFPKVTVGGTHIMLMASCLAKGETHLTNAACEPEIVNLAECLIAMGAKIKGAGTPNISITGVERLGGARVKIIPDRIEAGTLAAAVGVAGGNVLLSGANKDHLGLPLTYLEQAGISICEEEGGLRVSRRNEPLRPLIIETAAYPGFPTDLQAQFMGLMSIAKGTSRITETIFENRFMHVQELARLGANISLSGQTATIEGVEQLEGAEVMATDLRASVTLAIAGLGARGETLINRIYHLDRGFERLEEKLSRCGALIERIYA